MHRSASRISRPLLSFIFLLALAATPMLVWAQAADTDIVADISADIATWNCLPEETAFAIRIPNGKAIAEACVQNTKLGAVLFSEKRKLAVVEALQKNNSDEWSEFHEKLSEYGLTTDELLQFFAGESGYAILVVNVEQGEALALGLAWLEPGAELAARAYEILAQAIDEQEDNEHPVTRVDLELADHAVMQLALPSVSMEYPDEMDMPEGYDEMPYEEQRAAWDQAYKVWQNGAVEKVRYGTVLVSTLDGRVLVAHSFRTSAAPDAHPDSEVLAGIFARLLAEHERGEGGFVAKYADDPSVARTLSLDGLSAFELLGDVAALMQLGRDDWGTQGEKTIRLLGLQSLGPFAARSTLEGNHWHGQFSLAISRPLEGLMQCLDQPLIESEPPAWVPADVIAYAQYSFDLGKAYAILAEQIRREFPDFAERWIAMAESQVTNFAQVGLEELLSSLGTRHTVVNFVSETNRSADLESQQPQSTAIVWQVTDEQIWTRVMQALAPRVNSMPGGEFTDEQGYNGFRFKSEAIEGGLFLGNGNLVLAYGAQVLETTLSSLNNPPEGSGAFRGGEIYERATELLEPAPSMGYRVVDGNRYAAIARDLLLAMLRQYEATAKLYEEKTEEKGMRATWLELARALMPTDKEVQDLLGVAVGRWEVNDHGIFGLSVQELPAPDDR